jgi:hypothetical protein
LPFLIVATAFLRLLFVGISIGLISDEAFLLFFVVGGSGRSSDSDGDVNLTLLFDITGSFERPRVEGGSGDGTAKIYVKLYSGMTQHQRDGMNRRIISCLPGRRTTTIQSKRNTSNVAFRV